MNAKKFEAHHLVRYGKKISSDPEIAREYASSHCAFQIMGWHMKFDLDGKKVDRGEWFNLYDPKVCVREFERIMGNCMERNKEKGRYDQLASAFECFNGSKEEARARMELLAREAIEKL